jgi:RNA polymerase sigma-70 factor (ECF subfamily)
VDLTTGIEFEDDIALMLRVQRCGDAAAFAELAGRYRGQIKRFFAALLPDPALADDFAQETLLRLWLSRHRYRPTGKFSAYLFQIARHYYLNQRLRYRARMTREVSTDTDAGAGLEIALSQRTQPEIVFMEQRERQLRAKAIANLPGHYSAVFELSHFEGMKDAEIACRLGIPIGTVKSRMAEAVRLLRQRLSNDEEEADHG